MHVVLTLFHVSVLIRPGYVEQVHGEVVRIFAEGADQHLKHGEQSNQEQSLARRTGVPYHPKPDPFPIPALVEYLQKCLAASKHSRRYSHNC